MAFENNRCFAWCTRLKQSCNERWARFRNRFRQRFYSSRGRSLDQSTVLNETGTPDMVLNKVPLMANKVAPANAANMALRNAVSESPAVDNISITDGGTDFDRLVEDYVSSVISQAADNLISERKQWTLDNDKVISADDRVSLTSSIISQIADSAVTESLTNIVTENDKNQSASIGPRPRTVKEFMEMFGLTDVTADDDALTRVSC